MGGNTITSEFRQHILMITGKYFLNRRSIISYLGQIVLIMHNQCSQDNIAHISTNRSHDIQPMLLNNEATYSKKLDDTNQGV